MQIVRTDSQNTHFFVFLIVEVQIIRLIFPSTWSPRKIKKWGAHGVVAVKERVKKIDNTRRNIRMAMTTFMVTMKRTTNLSSRLGSREGLSLKTSKHEGSYFSIFVWVIFALLDLGSGSEILLLTFAFLHFVIFPLKVLTDHSN